MSVKDRIQPDLYYALHQSWRLDLALRARTVVLLGMGQLKGQFIEINHLQHCESL